MIVTMRATERYIERVAPSLTLAEARAAIHAHERAIETAIRFHAGCVRLGSGHRLVLHGECVVTVLPRGAYPSRRPVNPAFWECYA